MTFELRQYQDEAVDSIFSYFVTHNGNPIIAMPTGTGKSIVIAELVRKIFHAYPNQRVQMITHVKTLIDQNFKKLLLQWPTAPAGIYSAGLRRRDTSHPIIFGGIQSIYKRAHEFGHVDLLLVDECHLVPSNNDTMYRTYIEGLKAINPFLKVIGLSATPYRLKGGHLCEGKTFTDVAFDNTHREEFNKLVDQGYIAPLVPKQTELEIDIKGVHTIAGEYDESELEERVAGDVTERALLETIREGHDRKCWFVFGVSIAHVDTIVESLNRLGISAVGYHSQVPPKIADLALEDFKAGKYRAIVSKNRLTTGVDIEQLDLIAMLRPTQSPGLWVQMLGRGTRPYPGKANCLVLDFAGNTRRLGPINDPVIKKAGKGRGGGGAAPVKVCPECLTYNALNATICIHCGYEWKVELKIADKASTAELIRRTPQPLRTMHVDRVTYRRHSKEGKPDSLCVSYFCGLVRVQEYICPAHGRVPWERARLWWGARTPMAFPGTLNGMMETLNHLAPPNRIIVDFNNSFPEIKKVEFDA